MASEWITFLQIKFNTWRNKMCILKCVTFLFICRAFTIGNPSNNYPLGALIYPNPIKITDHGMYQCRYTGCADSYIGQLNVEGELYCTHKRIPKVLRKQCTKYIISQVTCILFPFLSVSGTPQLNFFPLNTQLNFTLTAGSNDTRTILTYGYPSPTFTLRKKSSGGGYTDITASEPTFTVNSETLTMSGVERSHSGDYQIVATNTHGSYMLNFTLTVTGWSCELPSEYFKLPMISTPVANELFGNGATISLYFVYAIVITLHIKWFIFWRRV